MKLFRKEPSLVLWCFIVSLFLSSCGGAGPECGSLDTRNSVVKIVSDDNNNKLVNYAVKNSSLYQPAGVRVSLQGHDAEDGRGRRSGNR
jgi:hypothetical protein